MDQLDLVNATGKSRTPKDKDLAQHSQTQASPQHRLGVFCIEVEGPQEQ